METQDTIANRPKPASQQEASEEASVPGIFAVVVLYKVRPEDSATLQTLAAAAQAAGEAVRLRTLICDNTPGGQQVGTFPDGVRYLAAPHNPGLSEAYNTAIAAASAEGYEWLLTLDQDTHLPTNFLTVLARLIPRFAAESRVAAIVPYIVDGDRPISPLRFVGGFLPRMLPAGFTGVTRPFTSPINSASLLRVAALQEVGGYDKRFPLNNSDTDLFHRLGKAGKRVAVAGDLTVKHELAILKRQERMTVERYRQLLADERAFWDLEMSFLARVERWMRLVGRVGKDARHRGNGAFQKVTLAEILHRMVTRRKTRIAAWKGSFGVR